jgi:hypothetical protein
MERIVKLFPDLDLHSYKKLSRDLSMNWTKKLSDESEAQRFRSALSDLLQDARQRWFFKAYAMNEYAQEGILFYEDATRYKALTDKTSRKEKALKIFNYYLKEKSIAQINTKQLLVDPVKNALEKDEYEDDLFDDLVKDIVGNVLGDIYFRFKFSPMFQEMTSQNTTIRLVC